LLGLSFAQATSKTFDGVAGTGKSMRIDQVLVDGHVVALETQLDFDECAVWLADGAC
jgi:hypothetical protein